MYACLKFGRVVCQVSELNYLFQNLILRFIDLLFQAKFQQRCGKKDNQTNILMTEKLCVIMQTGLCTDKEMQNLPHKISIHIFAPILFTPLEDLEKMILLYLLMNIKILRKVTTNPSTNKYFQIGNTNISLNLIS